MTSTLLLEMNLSLIIVLHVTAEKHKGFCFYFCKIINEYLCDENSHRFLKSQTAITIKDLKLDYTKTKNLSVRDGVKRHYYKMTF